MSSARFLLEFEATGDQEVVNAIKEVGTAGKETAADLDALKNIEDPFSSLSEGADSAIGPIQEVGSAATETVAPLEDMGSATEELGGIFGEAGTSTADFTANMDAVGGAADATVGGLTDANKVVEDFGGAATTAGSSATDFGSSVTNITGGVAALGGIIGSTVSALFRYQDIQLKVQKAQLAAARAAETYRKSEASLSALLKTATSNSAGIAAARQRLADAQGRVNELMDQGVTSGAEWEAAQTELAAAQAALSAEFAKGGGNVAKLTTEMNKNEIAAGKNATASANLDKVNRQANQGVLDLVFTYVSLAGTLVQTIGGLSKTTAAVKGAATAFKTLIPAMTGVGLAAAKVAIPFAALVAIMTAIQVDAGGVKTKMTEIHDSANKAIPALTPIFDHMGKSFHSNVEGMGDMGRQLTDLLGITMPASVDVAKKKTEELGTSTKTAGTAMASTIDMTKGFNSILQTSASTVGTAEGVVAKLGGSFVTLGSNLKDLGNGYSTVNGVIVKNSDILNRTGLSTDKAAESAKKLQANWQDVTATGEEMHNSIAQLNTTLSENIDKNYEQAHAILTLVDSEQNHTEAISAVNLAYAQSVDAVADMNAVLGDQTAHQEAVDTAINKTIESVKGEQIALEAAIAATQNKVIQDQKLTNAKLEGTKAAMEFISSLDEEKASQQANISVLHNAVSAMGVFGTATIQSADQLEQFAAVAAGVPSAIRELAGEIGGLAQEANKFIEFSDKSNELFANWTVSDKIPTEIRAMMSDADIAFIHGRAALERTMESLGPLTGAKFAKAIQTAKQGGLEELRKFGPEAAALLRSGFPTMDAALTELTDSFAALGTATDAQMIPAMARVVTAMQNVEDPAASLTQQMLALQQQSGASAAPLLSVAGGLEQLSAAGADATVKLSEIPLVKITDDAGNAVAEFANFNGQLVPIGGAAQGAAAGLGAMTGKVNPLNAAIQLAAKSLQQFQSYLGQNMPKFDIDIAPAAKKLQSLVATMSSIRQSSVPVFTIDVGPALAQLNKIKTALGGVKSGQAGINLNPAPALASIKKVINEMAKIRQGKIPQIQLNISPAVSAANKIRSIVNALPNIKRTITYTYRIVGSRPNPPNLSRTITYRYRTVGSRPAQTGMHETLGEDTMIAAHKGERVDITPNTINTNEERIALVPGGGGKRGAEYVIPVTLMLDNKVLVRTVSRGLMEDVGGVS